MASVKYEPSSDKRSGNQIVMIKVRHTYCQLFACANRAQSDFMVGTDCKKYQWAPKISIGYNLNVIRQSACLVISPITVDGYAALFNCTPVDRASDSMMARPKAIHFSWLGPELSSVAWSTGAQLIIFFCFRFSVVLFDRPGISIRHAARCVCRVLVFASS